MHAIEVLGVDDATSGLLSSLLQAGTGAVSAGVQYKNQKDAADKAAKAGAAGLAAVLAADQAATIARGKALISVQESSSSLAADQMAADLADQAQDAAGAGLSDDNQKKRVAAATKAVEKATAEWQSAAQKDAKTAKEAELRLKAAQATLAKAENKQFSSGAGAPGAGAGGSKGSHAAGGWSTMKKVGVAVGAVGGAGALGGLLWAILRRRK